MTAFEDSFEHALEIGRQNEEVIGLIRRHCSHARIEKFGGTGIPEQVTGLPIGMRGVRCQYASQQSMSSMNLEHVAVAFYRQNCVGCPHRAPVGVPNLGQLVASLDEEQRLAKEREERRAAMEAEATQERTEARLDRVRTEPAPTRQLVEAINRLDVSPGDTEAAEELISSAQAAPELWSADAVDLLVDACRELGSGPLLASLGHLVRASVVSAALAVDVAVEVLAHDIESEAARLLLANAEELLEPGPGDSPQAKTGAAARLAPARRTIVRMAGRFPSHGLFSPSAPRRIDTTWPDVFGLLYLIDPVGVLAEVTRLLNDVDDYSRSRGAAAAELVVQMEPGVIPVLAQELVQALDRPAERCSLPATKGRRSRSRRH